MLRTARERLATHFTSSLFERSSPVNKCGVQAHTFARPADEADVTIAKSRPEPAVITLISADSVSERMSGLCFVKHVQGDRLIVRSQRRPRVPSTVRVEYRDLLLIGETVRSVPTSSGWTSEILVGQIQTGSQSLLNLGKSLLGYDARGPRSLDVSVVAPGKGSSTGSGEGVLTEGTARA